MSIHRPHLYSLSLKALSQLIFICVLFTGLAVAQGSDSDKVQSLIVQLSHPDLNKRLWAANSLAMMGDKGTEAVPQLIEMLKTNDENVALIVVLTLSMLDEKSVVPHLINVLKYPDARVRERAANALERMGRGAKGAVPQLTEALSDPDENVRISATIALGKIGEGAKIAVPRIAQMLKDPGTELDREAAILALTDLGEVAEEAVPHLVEALNNPDEKVRRSAAVALGKIGKGEQLVVPQLIKALGDPDPGVRMFAATSLDQLSTILAREKKTEFSDDLNTAADIMRNSIEPSVNKYADSVQQASDLLKLQWWEQLKQWVFTHRTISLLIIAYPLLLLTWFVFLWLRPLWLLHINEALAKTTDVKLPEKLGGFNVAPRYLILVGLFHYHSRVLDAWVTKYISSAQKMFSDLPTVEERKIYVPLPVVLGNESEADLSPSKLRPLLSRSLLCLQIWGEGGVGKTSLACRLAQWAMSPQKEARLNADHLMLPLLLEQDLVIQDKDAEHPLFKAISQQVRVMINEDDPPPTGLLRQLLKKRRVLVIIDGFSEMNKASRTATLAGITDLPVNASIITTRSDEQLGGIPKTEMKPLRVKGNRLATFMEAYLTARRKRDLFEDEEYFEACRRLSLIVGDRDITALLAKLYAEQMIALKEGATDGDAPENIPDLMLSYLNDLCRGAGPDDPDIRVVHEAAKSIAWECLKKTLKPMPARRDDVLSALGGEEKGKPLLKYLEEKLKVVQTVGAGRDRVRFALDPLAEYLAAMHLMNEQGDDELAWRNFLAQVDEQGGEPEDVEGFLLAVRDCCLAKEKDMPGLRTIADELATRAGVSPEESNRYKIERRVRQLKIRLKYSEDKDRSNAAWELGSIGNPAKIAVVDLCTLLRDQNVGVRSSAIGALGKLGKVATSAVPQLLEALKDPDENVRAYATGALTRIGREAKEAVVPQLIEALKHPEADARNNAAIALGAIGEEAPEVVPPLIEALKHPNAIVRSNAASTLGYIGKRAKGAVLQLIQSLKDHNADVRSNAAYALGEIAAKEAVPQLVEALNDPEAEVRSYAANALRNIGKDAKEAVPSLIQALKDPATYVRIDAARALGELGGDARKVVELKLIQALKDKDDGVRRSAAEALRGLRVLGKFEDLDK